MNKYIQGTLILWTALLLASCGGGSSSPAPVQEPVAAPAPNQPATVGIIITDASADDYDHAWATITSVELIGGDGGHEPIFEGEEMVDLLALRESVHLFAVNENVTPGDYDKIRMHVSELTLVKNVPEGEPETTPVEIVANGKVDLNPRQTFTIGSGEVVFVSFDWDVDKSLKLTETGKGNGKIIMRPVIFVEIGTVPAFKEGLVRMHGNVDLVAPDFASFRLCSPQATTQQLPDGILNSFCVDIVITGKTGLFGENGMPILVSDLAKDMPVTVLGLLRRSGDSASGTLALEDENGPVKPTPFQILSIVVEGGPLDTWQQIRGVLTSVVDVDTSAFDFAPAAGQGFPDETVFTGQLYDTSRIFRFDAATGVTEILAGELAENDAAVVDAVEEPAESGIQNIAIMMARTPGDPPAEALRGTLLSVDTDADPGTLMVTTASGDIAVATTVDTNVFLVYVTGDSVESVEAGLGDLVVGNPIVVTGSDDGTGFVADLIVGEGAVSP